MPKRNCEIAGCDREAQGVYRWIGSGEQQEGALCEEHGNALWKTLGPLCAINKAFLVIHHPGSDYWDQYWKDKDQSDSNETVQLK